MDNLRSEVILTRAVMWLCIGYVLWTSEKGEGMQWLYGMFAAAAVVKAYVAWQEDW